MNNIIIREDLIDRAILVSATVPEFDSLYEKSYFENRYKDKTNLILVAYINSVPVGYMVSYDKYNDGSFYCWMAGVNPKYRRLGVLITLMEYLENWTRKHGFKKIVIKTRNNRREMLSYLIKEGFNFIEIQSRSLVKDNRIVLEKIVE